MHFHASFTLSPVEKTTWIKYFGLTTAKKRHQQKNSTSFLLIPTDWLSFLKQQEQQYISKNKKKSPILPSERYHDNDYSFKFGRVGLGLLIWEHASNGGDGIRPYIFDFVLLPSENFRIFVFLIWFPIYIIGLTRTFVVVFFFLKKKNNNNMISKYYLAQLFIWLVSFFFFFFLFCNNNKKHMFWKQVHFLHIPLYFTFFFLLSLSIYLFVYYDNRII